MGPNTPKSSRLGAGLVAPPGQVNPQVGLTFAILAPFYIYIYIYIQYMYLYRPKHPKVNPTWCLTCRPPRASQPPIRSDFGHSGPFIYIYIYI